MSLRAWLIGALLVLQGADVVLTWKLLSTQPDVIEANPVAVAVLSRHGWAGAVLLKAASTAVALGCALHIWRTRPGVGRRLLGGLCAVMLTVVCYSGALLARPAVAGEAEAAATDMAGALDEQWAHLWPLKDQRDQLCADLLAGRLTLPEAVRRMSEGLSRHRGQLKASARSPWPHPGNDEQVAQFLLLHCVGGPAMEGKEEALRGLHEQFARSVAGRRGPPGGEPGELGWGGAE